MKYHEKSKNRLILLPRSHRKTTYCTAADALQIALPDDLGICPYPRNLGPNVRIAIIHETDTMASNILREIQNWVLQNEALRLLFPDILPEDRTRRVNTSQLEFNRTATWKEPTFETMGVGTKAQGRHYNRLKLDDIYGPEARDSLTSRLKTKQWFDELQPFLVTPKNDGFDLVGTRWDHEDIYAHAMDKFGEKLPRYIRSVVEFNSTTQLYEPIFPEMFTMESLEELKKNKKLWTANYLNAPDFRENPDLDPSWIRHYEWTDHKKEVIVGFTGTERIKRHVSELDKVLFIDPAVEGDAGWAITGTDWMSNKPNVFVLDAFRGPIPPDQMINKVFNAVERWNLRAVVIEEVLFSRLYRHWLEDHMRHRGFYFKIIAAKTGQKQKDARVLGLTPYFAAGQVFFHKSQEALHEEYRQFGLGSSYHILDALAYGPEFWRASVDRGVIERRRKTDEKFRSQLDSLTGYTRIA
jgi:predicted phage terminase large subunit-like protein